VIGTLDPSLADAVFTPNSTVALLTDVSGAGDVNNDGFDDLLIGMDSSLGPNSDRSLASHRRRIAE